MKRFLRGIACALCLLCIGASGFAQETIRIATGEYPPFLSEELKYHGVGIRVITEAFALEGVRVEYGWFPWKRAYELMKSGAWDCTGTWRKTPDREKDGYFSDPLYPTAFTFFHRKDFRFDWKSMDDLGGLFIGATIGYGYGQAFGDAEKWGSINVERVPTDLQNFRKLLAGRIHLFPINPDVGYDLLSQGFTPQEAELITHHPRPLLSAHTNLVFSRKVERNRRMVILFNRGLKQLRESGKIAQYFRESRQGEYHKGIVANGAEGNMPIPIPSTP